MLLFVWSLFRGTTGLRVWALEVKTFNEIEYTLWAARHVWPLLYSKGVMTHRYCRLKTHTAVDGLIELQFTFMFWVQ